MCQHLPARDSSRNCNLQPTQWMRGTWALCRLCTCHKLFAFYLSWSSVPFMCICLLWCSILRGGAVQISAEACASIRTGPVCSLLGMSAGFDPLAPQWQSIIPCCLQEGESITDSWTNRWLWWKANQHTASQQIRELESIPIPWLPHCAWVPVEKNRTFW